MDQKGVALKEKNVAAANLFVPILQQVFVRPGGASSAIRGVHLRISPGILTSILTPI